MTMESANLAVTAMFAQGFAVARNGPTSALFRAQPSCRRGCDLRVFSVCAGAFTFPARIQTFFSAGQSVAAPRWGLGACPIRVGITQLFPRLAVAVCEPGSAVFGCQQDGPANTAARPARHRSLKNSTVCLTLIAPQGPCCLAASSARANTVGKRRLGRA